MSIKFFRNTDRLFKFDPDTCQCFACEAGIWIELKEFEQLDEVRYRTVELSPSEALCGCHSRAQQQ